MKFVLTGESAKVVPKKNSRITLRNGVSIPSNRFRAWHKKAYDELMEQGFFGDNLEVEEPIERCTLEVTFTLWDRRRRDIDNALSSILDLLVDAEIIKDDSWQVVNPITIKANYEKNSPKVEIIINEQESI